MKSKTGAITLTAAQKKLKIVELRRRGMTYEEIGNQIGCTRSYAYKIVKKHLQEVNAQAVKEIALLAADTQDKLEEIIRVCGADLRDPDNRRDFLKALEARARLRGLNEAERVDLRHQLPATIERNVLPPIQDDDN